MTPIHHVALIDDDADVRTLGGLALRNVGGWECTLFASGEEARVGLPRLSVDVVLLDVMLGQEDGVALLAQFRTAGLDVPVIFLTGRILPDDVLRYEQSGALGVIAKPFNPLSLPEKVRSLHHRDDPDDHGHR